MRPPFADRLAALVEERRSQICLGLDPDPAALPPDLVESFGGTDGDVAGAVGAAVAAHCRRLIEAAGDACVAVKPQLACFERLGAAGWAALTEVTESAQAAGLLVIADGKRGDVPVSAAAYGQSLFGATPSALGTVSGLGADAATVNPLLGLDALEPLVAAAAETGAGLFCLVRTSNPGAADFLDLIAEGRPVHEHVSAMVEGHADRLLGESGLSGLGAVVGATSPGHLPRLRELMPRSVFLLPGVGAQGGDAAQLGGAFGGHPASAVVTASRSVAGAADPARSARELRDRVWAVGGGRA